MRKYLIGLALIAVCVGYLAWPLRDLAQFVQAIEQRDIATVTKRVDFVRVRQSITRQLVEDYALRTGSKGGLLGQGIGGSVAESYVAKIVTPEALADLLVKGWPGSANSSAPSDTVSLSSKNLGNAWSLFVASDYWFDRFEIAVPTSAPAGRTFGLQLRLTKWHWRLSAVRLPDSIRSQLEQEILKATPKQSPAT